MDDQNSANSRQVGGDHYKRFKYEHWDWVADAGVSYWIAAATKYILRRNEKGGREDLEKAKHYLEKALELEDFGYDHYAAANQFALSRATDRFLHASSLSVSSLEGEVFRCVECQMLADALQVIDDCLNYGEAPAEEPGPGYVNQDR